MNRNNRRSMGTLKIGSHAQRTSSSGVGAPPSTNKKSKLPKPSSTVKSSRGRSGSMDRPTGNAAAALGEFKTPRSKSAMTRTPLSNLHQNSNARNSLHPSSAMRNSIYKRGRSPGKRSSVYGAGAPVKDNRPIGDKKWQNETVHELIQFCFDHVSNDQSLGRLTPKDLFQMSSTTFRTLFEFLYGFLNPGYTLPSNKTQPIHEVVPDLLKKLSYPGTVSKSHFQTLGGPSFGNVLGVFHFLLVLAKTLVDIEDNINLHCFPNHDDEGFSVPDKASKQELEYQYLTGAYREYYAGKDEFPELLNEFSVEYLNQKGVSENLLNELQSKVRQLAKENEDLKSESGDLSHLEEKNAEINQDIKNLEVYIGKCQENNQRKARTVDEVRESISQLESSIEMLMLQKKELEEECVAKGIDYKDTSNHNQEIILSLQARVDARKADLQEIDQEKWVIEQDMSKISAAIDGHKRNFTKMLVKLDDPTLARKFKHTEVDHLPIMIHELVQQLKEEKRIMQKNVEDLKQKLDLCKSETAKKEKLEVALSKELGELKTNKVKLEQEIKIQDETLTRKVKEVKDKLATYSNSQNKLGSSLKSKEEQLETLTQQKLEAEQKLEKFILESHRFLQNKVDQIEKKKVEQEAQRAQAIKEYKDYEERMCKEVDKTIQKIKKKIDQIGS